MGTTINYNLPHYYRLRQRADLSCMLMYPACNRAGGDVKKRHLSSLEFDRNNDKRPSIWFMKSTVNNIQVGERQEKSYHFLFLCLWTTPPWVFIGSCHVASPRLGPRAASGHKGSLARSPTVSLVWQKNLRIGVLRCYRLVM